MQKGLWLAQVLRLGCLGDDLQELLEDPGGGAVDDLIAVAVEVLEDQLVPERDHFLAEVLGVKSTDRGTSMISSTS